MDDCKVKKILSYIEEGGGYSMESLPTFKTLYPALLDYFYKLNAKSQFKSDVVQILSLSKFDDMFVAEAKFVNRKNNKSSIRKISLMLNDTKILALIKDYEYMLKRNLRYVNDLYKELKKRNISPIDFSMDNNESHIENLFSFIKDKLPSLDNFANDYEKITEVYSSKAASISDLENEIKVSDQTSCVTCQSDDVIKDVEEDMNSSLYKKVTFSPRNEIIDIPVNSPNRLDNTSKVKKRKILEKDIPAKTESKNTYANLSLSTPFNEIFITKKKLQFDKSFQVSPESRDSNQKRNKIFVDNCKVLNTANMSNYLDIIDVNDCNNLEINIDQLYDEPFKPRDDDDFETMVNSSELLKNLRADDDIIKEQQKVKKEKAFTETSTKPESVEKLVGLDTNLEICEQLKGNGIVFSSEECSLSTTDIKENILEGKTFDPVLLEKFKDEQISNKKVDDIPPTTLLTNPEIQKETISEIKKTKPNLFDTNFLHDKKNYNLFKDIFNESKMNAEIGQKLDEGSKTNDKPYANTKKSNQMSENVVNEAEKEVMEEKKKVTRTGMFKDKDILQINRKKEDKKIDVSFLLSKIRYKRT